MGDSLLTGSNEIGLAFGEALAPDSDGLAKPIAVERRPEPGRVAGCSRMRREGPRPVSRGSWPGFLDGEEAPARCSGPGLVRHSAAAGS